MKHRHCLSLAERVADLEAMLALAPHDIDRLHRERDAELTWLAWLLDTGLIQAAREAIARRFG
ncbi:hypothetical protein RFN28_32595 [Mesorhizobium sp. VK24D]|uniref:Uncharacterized protein n=1 Tax=Mesorhizobium album TaxID=3072314 RepID=A0ABU4Y8W2_9HYPH|nr:hypothetical protein [Mesorhizobium sp. VK24D]MDX8483156.1 hypothetical protein [Mesorhizobium sp. VK24D]